MASYGSLPFAEQIRFFQGKLRNLPTARWDDLLGAAHDRAFVVAGAMKADLLADLRAAVAKGIEQGQTLETFRRDFDAIVAKHGWTGWTGSDSAAGRAWRTEVIYGTNLRTSYAAGRYQQLQEVKPARPYWRYRHNDTVMHPRPVHVGWDGKILHADHPWWQTHYPPNGWGCCCYVESLAPRDLKRLGIDPDKLKPPTAPGDLTGIDKGWDYAPGAGADAAVSPPPSLPQLPGPTVPTPPRAPDPVTSAATAQASSLTEFVRQVVKRTPWPIARHFLRELSSRAFSASMAKVRDLAAWLLSQGEET